MAPITRSQARAAQNPAPKVPLLVPAVPLPISVSPVAVPEISGIPFMRLPIEIRHMIWKAALPASTPLAFRVLKLGSGTGRMLLDTELDSGICRQYNRRSQVQNRIHANRSLLLSCREARDELQRHLPDILPIRGGKMRFNAAQDIVWLTGFRNRFGPREGQDRDRSYEDLCRCSLSGWNLLIRNVGLTSSFLLKRDSYKLEDIYKSEDEMGCLATFTNLQHAVVICGYTFNKTLWDSCKSPASQQQARQQLRGCYGWTDTNHHGRPLPALMYSRFGRSLRALIFGGSPMLRRLTEQEGLTWLSYTAEEQVVSFKSTVKALELLVERCLDDPEYSLWVDLFNGLSGSGYTFEHLRGITYSSMIRMDHSDAYNGLTLDWEKRT